MFTQNYYNLIANMVASAGATTSNVDPSLILIDVYGVPHAEGFNWNNSFPYNVSSAPTVSVDNISSSSRGICIGTDNTPPTLCDTTLKSQITSGISMSLASTVRGCDVPGSPYVEYKISVTNTSSEPITIREIGYKQNANSLANTSYIVLLDRTVLEEPLTIQAGDSGIIDYKLQTLPVERTKNGVRLVSWTYGSDEDIAAMIDAAQQGLIDLQEDGGWRVGEFRTIHVGAWTGGGSVSHAETDIKIVISQFGDYNECGSVMQFDFFEVFPEKQRMHSSSTNVGGYGASEMYTTTLPALVEALPSWLKMRLKTFSVVATKGNQSTALETITNNKLALRSASELFSSPGSSFGTEGSQIVLYAGAPDSVNGSRKKNKARTTSSEGYLLRSPSLTGNTSYGAMTSSSALTAYTASSVYVSIAPFGCL